MSVITGVTELSPRMTVLQVVAWVAYLAVVIPAFVRPAGRRRARARARRRQPAGRAHRPPPRPRPPRPPRSNRRHRPGSAGGSASPRAARGWSPECWSSCPRSRRRLTIAALPSAERRGFDGVTVTRTGCAPEWTSGQPGTQTFTVHNNSGQAGEVNLDDAAGAVVGRDRDHRPGHHRRLTATLGPGTYTFKCLMSGQAGHRLGDGAGDRSRTAQTPPPPSSRVAVAELAGPNKALPGLRRRRSCGLAGAAAAIGADLRQRRPGAARRDWLTAQLDWERVGASYNSFGDLGVAVDGLPDGLRGGVNDKGFTGLHRIEYGLWHGQSPP